MDRGAVVALVTPFHYITIISPTKWIPSSFERSISFETISLDSLGSGEEVPVESGVGWDPGGGTEGAEGLM